MRIVPEGSCLGFPITGIAVGPQIQGDQASTTAPEGPLLSQPPGAARTRHLSEAPGAEQGNAKEAGSGPGSLWKG